MEAIEKLARLLAIQAGVDPDAEREPRSSDDASRRAAGHPLDKRWMDYVAEAMATLATLPANSPIPSLPR